MSENKPDLMAELAACPFCGSTGATVGGMIPWVECDQCEASGPQCATDAEAIEAWNHRTHHAELEAVVRDAARYRWLRDSANTAQGVAPMVLMVDKKCSPAFDQPGYGHKSMRDGEYLDAAIDQAMHNSAREG